MPKELKTFTMLREFVGHNYPTVAPITTTQAVDDVDNAPGAHSVENPVNLDKLNGYLSAIQNGQYLNPYYPLNRLWAKLQMIGLNFDLKAVVFTGESGSVSVPLNQFGGRFGFLDNSGQVKSDDGISHRIPGGLHLVLHWVNRSGLYSLTATMKPPATKRLRSL